MESHAPAMDEQFNSPEAYDVTYLDKYHSTKVRNDSKILEETKTPEGIIVKLYSNERKEVTFPSGTKKEIFNDGYEIIYFYNKDIKQIYPNGKEVYYFADQKGVYNKYPNGITIYKFNSGQIEKHSSDNKKIIKYPDGTIKTIYPN